MNKTRLKRELWDKGIKQVEVASILRDKYGFTIDDSRLAKMLNGWIPIPPEIESAIYQIIEGIKKS